MVVCPVCEHPQAQGDTCDVCGRDLRESGATAIPTPPLVGLESTALEEGESAAVEPMPELTSHRAPETDAASLPLPDLEPTSLPLPAPSVLEPFPDLEQSLPAGKSPFAGAPILACRYCGHRQGRGALCERCGMQLPRVSREQGAAGEGLSSCPVCGVKGRLRERCPACGAQLRPSRSTT